MVGSRPWACGPGRTTTKLGCGPLRRSFVVISNVLIDDFISWTAEVLKEVRMFILKCEWWNLYIYIYIGFRGNELQIDKLRIYLFIVWPNQVPWRCPTALLELQVVMWHTGPNHRKSHMIGLDSQALLTRCRGKHSCLGKGQPAGDIGVGWIFGMVLIKRFAKLEHSIWHQFALVDNQYVCQLPRADHPARNPKPSQRRAPPKEASQWPSHRAEYVAPKQCFCHQWLGAPNVDWWIVEPWLYSPHQTVRLSTIVYCNCRQRFSQKLVLGDW